MSKSDAFALQQSDLNGFLFAFIGVEAGGMDLSVISALARDGVDPWQEAGRLAKLPWTVAIDELARRIAAMPASLWPLPVATVIATRLVELLPRRQGVPALLPASLSAGASAGMRPTRPRARRLGMPLLGLTRTRLALGLALTLLVVAFLVTLGAGLLRPSPNIAPKPLSPVHVSAPAASPRIAPSGHDERRTE